MRVSCPACAASYEVPLHLLAPSRRLKCAQCDSEWLPQLPADEPVAVEPPPPPPAPEPVVADPPPPVPAPPMAQAPAKPAPAKPVPAKPPQTVATPAEPAPPEPATASVGELRERIVATERNEPPPKHRLPVLLTTAWAATFVLIATGFWGAYTYRGKVMHAWPPSQRAYAALGLEAEPK